MGKSLKGKIQQQIFYLGKILKLLILNYRKIKFFKENIEDNKFSMYESKAELDDSTRKKMRLLKQESP